MSKLPDWFKPEDADEELLRKFGPLSSGLFVRLWFVQSILEKGVKDNYAHIWVLWLPDKQFRYYPDPARLSDVWYTAKFHNTELMAFDENNSHELPEEFLDTIYLPHSSHDLRK